MWFIFSLLKFFIIAFDHIDKNSDCKNQKATYPGTVGLERARKDADQLIDEAIIISREFNAKGEYFALIARFVGQREN